MVILDLTMPEMGGEETFRELRKLRANVPVLLMSGYTEQEASAAFSSPVLAGFLQKPFNASQLVQKVGAVLAVNDAAQPNAIQR